MATIGLGSDGGGRRGAATSPTAAHHRDRDRPGEGHARRGRRHDRRVGARQDGVGRARHRQRPRGQGDRRAEGRRRRRRRHPDQRPVDLAHLRRRRLDHRLRGVEHRHRARCATWRRPVACSTPRRVSPATRSACRASRSGSTTTARCSRRARTRAVKRAHAQAQQLADAAEREPGRGPHRSTRGSVVVPFESRSAADVGGIAGADRARHPDPLDPGDRRLPIA